MNPPAALRSSIVIVALFTFLSSHLSVAQGCDECSKPRLSLYDSDVQVPRPTAADSIVAWYTLFWPSAVARSNMHTNDPAKDCIRWLDGAMVNAAELQGGVLKFGQEFVNLAPAGALKSTDYLMRSIVSGTMGAYTFTLILETGPSRERVKTVTVPFTSTPASAQAAGEAAAKQMMSLLQTIRTFEVDKRNSGVTVAIRDLWSEDTPADIEIVPEKASVDTGETIDLQITMIDCDGVPLKNRMILFMGGTMTGDDGSPIALDPTTGGTVSPRSATTDAEGKVTVRFTAGRSSGTGNIIGWYPHHKPCGRVSALHGDAMVRIKIPPTDKWIFHAEMMEVYTSNSDTSITYDLGGHPLIREYSTLTTQQTRGQVTALIRNFARDPVNDFFFNTDVNEPFGVLMWGSGFMDRYSTFRETIDGTLTTADIRSDNVAGTERPGASFSFEYSDEYKYFGATMGVKGVGSYHVKMYGPYDTKNVWKEYDGDHTDYGLSVGGGGDPEDTTNICWITKEGSKYSALASIYEKRAVDALGGTQRSLRKGYVKVSLYPVQLSTAIDDATYNGLLPTAYTLSQNYPNPFNPSTTITFQLKEKELARLRIFNILGEHVATLVDEVRPRGTHTVSWNAVNLPSGMYICQLQAGTYFDSRKMMLVK